MKRQNAENSQHNIEGQNNTRGGTIRELTLLNFRISNEAK
jgi:hypothetical protein